jgi:hypothetical protein
MQFGRWWEKVQSKEEQRRIMREASGCNDEEEEYHKGNLQCILHKQSVFLHSKKKEAAQAPLRTQEKQSKVTYRTHCPDRDTWAPLAG